MFTWQMLQPRCDGLIFNVPGFGNLNCYKPARTRLESEVPYNLRQ